MGLLIVIGVAIGLILVASLFGLVFAFFKSKDDIGTASGTSSIFLPSRSRDEQVINKRSGFFEGIAEEQTYGKYGNNDSEAWWNAVNGDRGTMIGNEIRWDDGTKSTYQGSFGWDHPAGHHIEYDD